MRVLPCGSAALLVELGSLEEVLGLYAAACDRPPPGVIDLVPAERTVLVAVEPGTDLDRVQAALRALEASPVRRDQGEPVELEVTYDGDDLGEVARHLGCDTAEVVRRHTGATWTVAFCGFAPGFAYLTTGSMEWDVPRLASPRTRVPAGAVGLAGRYSGVYPRESPGGWRLIGRTDANVFDVRRDPPALLRPGTPVRFVDRGRR